MTVVSSKLKSFSLGSVVVILSFVFCVVVLIWSVWAELDQVSRAPGQVIPTGRVQVVQSNDGGTIEKIFVKEGDKVYKGQVIVKLDQIKILAAVSEAEGKVASLKSSMVRINAELFDKPLVFGDDLKKYPDFISNQTLLYEKRRSAISAQLRALDTTLILMREELSMNAPLLASGDVSRADIIRLQRGVSDVESQKVNVRNKYVQDLQAEYTKIEEDLVSAREILAQRADSLADTQILAPSDGLVKNVRLTTIGGVLRPSDEVLTLVPTGDKLIVEVKVSPKDIAYVRIGQKSTIKFDAFDYSIYGSAIGKVIYISPDTLIEQSSKSDVVYYRVHISVDVSKMKVRPGMETIVIQPGMTAVAEILTGQTTVFDYMFKPIIKVFSESMGEP